MEAFSLLKYWRGGGGGGGGGDIVGNFRPTSGTVATIVTAVNQNIDGDDDDDEDDDDDDGPFFDLEFAVNDEDEEEAEVGEESTQNREQTSNSVNDTDLEEEEVNDGDDDDDDDEECNGDEREFNFTLSSGSSNDRTDQNLSLSPSDDLFFKGKLVPIESSSIVFSPSEPNSKPTQFPVSLLKSATKFRVFMLGLKKSRSNNSNTNNSGGEKTESLLKTESGNGSVFSAPKQQETRQKEPEKQSQKNQQQGKFFAVKFKVEEVPIVSLFTRDNSSRVSNKSQKQSSESETVSEEKRFAKEVMQKYLKMVKPLYVRVSRRYGEKLRFSGQLSLNGSVTKATSPPSTAAPAEQKPNPKAAPAPALTPAPASSSVENSQVAEPEVSEAPASNNSAKSLKQVNLPAGLRVVCKHLGKSRSASSTATVAPAGPAASKRRDDSLLQQQDGIQSAILHCKRSFNAARGKILLLIIFILKYYGIIIFYLFFGLFLGQNVDSESSLLSRCGSDPSNEKSLDMSRKSSDGDQRP